MLLQAVVLALGTIAPFATADMATATANATNTSSMTSRNETENASAQASAATAISSPSTDNVCSQPIVTGPCRAAIPRWAFNAEEGQCTRFTFGGCQGNDNNFPSKRLCEEQCGKPDPEPTSVCDLAPGAVGMCRAAFRRWTYNAAAGKCERFTWGGCGGNANRFETEKECEAECGMPPVDTCELAIVPGPCKAAFPRWGFDGEECVPFTYGGCGGNGNRFETEAACEATCEPEPPVDVCELDIVVGPCEAAIQSWGYDGTECIEFLYGGCEGNGNRFETEAACEAACEPEPPVDVCELDIVVGPCEALIPSWAFDGTECVQFNYGGCEGNGNRFETEAACDKACSPVSTCSLPLVTGRCRAAIPRWGFDGENCVEFTYGGCGGNSNRFETEEACRAGCSSEICALPTFPPELMLRCLALIPAFTFQDGECTAFSYGGCGATANLFFSEEDCEELCGDAGMTVSTRSFGNSTADAGV